MKLASDSKTRATIRKWQLWYRKWSIRAFLLLLTGIVLFVTGDLINFQPLVYFAVGLVVIACIWFGGFVLF